MGMLKHQPFCKNPKVQDRVNLYQINPDWFLPGRNLTVANCPDKCSLLIIKLTPRRKSLHRRRVKLTHHTTLFTPVSTTLAVYQDHVENLENKSEFPQTLYLILQISTTSN